MPDDNKKTELKVTDRRLFTSEGEIREEFREDIRPAPPSEQPINASQPSQADKKAERRRMNKGAPPGDGERRRTVAEKATSPETPFTNFVEPLIAQAYMSLGLLRNPYQPEPQVDAGAARQMIEILTLLLEKTAGNLTPEEDDFLATHIGELKLAFVQRTKSL